MIILFVHGWSVRHTETYGELPRWLAAQTDADGRPFKVENVFLGKYISFDDTVTIDDLAGPCGMRLNVSSARGCRPANALPPSPIRPAVPWSGPGWICSGKANSPSARSHIW